MAKVFIGSEVGADGMVQKTGGSKPMSWNCETSAIATGPKEDSGTCKGDDERCGVTGVDPNSEG